MHFITGLLLTEADWGMEIKVSTVFLWIKGFAKLISSIQNITLLCNFWTASLKRLQLSSICAFILWHKSPMVEVCKGLVPDFVNTVQSTS